MIPFNDNVKHSRFGFVLCGQARCGKSTHAYFGLGCCKGIIAPESRVLDATEVPVRYVVSSTPQLKVFYSCDNTLETEGVVTYEGEHGCDSTSALMKFALSLIPSSVTHATVTEIQIFVQSSLLGEGSYVLDLPGVDVHDGANEASTNKEGLSRRSLLRSLDDDNCLHSLLYFTASKAIDRQFLRICDVTRFSSISVVCKNLSLTSYSVHDHEGVFQELLHNMESLMLPSVVSALRERGELFSYIPPQCYNDMDLLQRICVGRFAHAATRAALFASMDCIGLAEEALRTHQDYAAHDQSEHRNTVVVYCELFLSTLQEDAFSSPTITDWCNNALKAIDDSKCILQAQRLLLCASAVTQLATRKLLVSSPLLERVLTPCRSLLLRLNTSKLLFSYVVRSLLRVSLSTATYSGGIARTFNRVKKSIGMYISKYVCDCI